MNIKKKLEEERQCAKAANKVEFIEEEDLCYVFQLE